MEKFSDNKSVIKLGDVKQLKSLSTPNQKNLNHKDIVNNTLIEDESVIMTEVSDNVYGVVKPKHSPVKGEDKTDIDEKLTERQREVDKEEEISLLGKGRCSQTISPHSRRQDRQIPTEIRLDCHHSDIQLAQDDTTDDETNRRKSIRQRRSLNVSQPWYEKYQISSLNTLCGPNPVKITCICVIILSIWASWMLLIHLNKKIDSLVTSLSETEEHIKTISDADQTFRLESNKKLRAVQKQLGKILQVIKSGSRGESSLSTTLPSIEPPITPIIPIKEESKKPTSNWWSWR